MYGSQAVLKLDMAIELAGNGDALRRSECKWWNDIHDIQSDLMKKATGNTFLGMYHLLKVLVETTECPL